MRFFDAKKQPEQTGADGAVPGRVSRVITINDASSLSDLLAESAAFWFSQYRDALVPDWESFSPIEHAKFLPNIMMCEVIDGQFFVRVTGETVVKHLPVKVANQVLSEIACPALSHLSADLTRASEQRLPIYVKQPNAWIFGDEIVGYDALHLPFRTEEHAATRILSVITFETEPKIDV